MTSLELLQEIDAWLSFNNHPSKEQINELRNDIKKHISEQLSVVFIVTDSSNYYQEPVTVRIFSTKEKAISFCDKKDPNRKYLDWEEFEVE